MKPSEVKFAIVFMATAISIMGVEMWKSTKRADFQRQQMGSWGEQYDVIYRLSGGVLRSMKSKSNEIIFLSQIF